MKRITFFGFVLSVLCFSSCKEDDPTLVSDIVCADSEITMYVGATQIASYNVLPENADDLSVYWEFSDSTVACAVGDSVIKGLSAGETWAYVVSKVRPEVRDSIKIFVVEPVIYVTSVECEETELNMTYGTSHAISCAVYPENADDASVRWEYSNESVAEVVGDTVVVARSLGETWVYAISNSQSEIKDSIKITVTQKNLQPVAVNDSKIHYEGRVVVTDTKASYFYPGSSFSISFTGTSLYARFERTTTTAYWVEVDDQEPYRLAMNSKARRVVDNLYCLAEELESGSHTAKVTMCTEGIYKNPAFYGFEIDEDASVLEMLQKPLKFEFIGNSITCGYGTEASSNKESFSDGNSNFCHTFAYATAKEFNAETMVVARSGIGIYRNYGDTTTASGYGSMPDNYEKLWIQNATEWDFTSYIPDVVFINLGTNDTWEMSSFDSASFDNGYRNLLNSVTTHYPNAKIVLLTGSMMSGGALAQLKPILNKLQEDYSDENHTVYRYDFAPTAGNGADWHPNTKQQAQMGENLIKYLRNNGIVE